MDKVLVYIDTGFLSKVSKHFGKGSHRKYDLVKFSKALTGKESLIFKGALYYHAPPYQSANPTEDEKERKEDDDNFLDKLSRCGNIKIRVGGRLQKFIKGGATNFKQKGVDSLINMDLSRIDIEHPKIKKIILIACDSDFVPPINALKERGIETILYTYSEKNRRSKFSTSNHLRKCVSKCVQLKGQDFDDCRLF